MMRFAPPARRPVPETIVPMINVVFLLLIFFLMTARIAPPAPIEVTPPRADAPSATQAPDTLHLGADGTLAYGAARGEGVFAALATRDTVTPLAIRADAGLAASDLAALLPRLAAVGVQQITLITGAP